MRESAGDSFHVIMGQAFGRDIDPNNEKGGLPSRAPAIHMENGSVIRGVGPADDPPLRGTLHAFLHRYLFALNWHIFLEAARDGISPRQREAG